MPLVTYTKDDQLGHIVIDNPPVNLFTADAITDLFTAVAEAAQSGARAIVLRAAGSDFSAGADVAVFDGLDEARAQELEKAVLSGTEAIEALPVPVVALVQGKCFTGALEMCLACDFIWAAEDAQLGQFETLAGGMPFAGGTQRIASRVGLGRAAELVLTGAILPPETLESWGLVNRVLPADQLAQDGIAFAKALANGPTLSYKAIKQVLRVWRSGGVTAADAVVLSEGPSIMLSQDLHDGVASLARDGIGHAVFNGR